MKRTSITLMSCAMIAALTTGCSTKADSEKSSSGDIKTDVGVTDSEISVGALTDLSGPYKALGLGFTAGNQMWADAVNADGGICGRDVTLNIKDMATNVDAAATHYATMKDESVGILQLAGSSVLAALKQQIINDNIVAIAPAWSSLNLDSPNIVMIGPTYDIEMLNGLSYLQEQGIFAEGDSIAHVYVDSEYGQNAAMGSEAYAKANGLDLISVPVGGTDTDMTATVTKLKSDGVKAIAVSTTPTALASIALQNKAQQLDVPLLGSGPTFAPTILDDSAVVDGLSSNYYLVQNTVPFGDGGPLATEISEKYAEYSSDEPSLSVNQGYVQGLGFGAILEEACEAKDLTRAGLIAAREKVDSVDTQKLTGPVDLSQVGAPSGRQSYIDQIAPDAPGGLKIIESLYESEEAGKYEAPHE